MMQSLPQSHCPHLRVFLLVTATAMMTLGTVVIMPSAANSQQLNAQTTSSDASQDIKSASASPTNANGTSNQAQSQGNESLSNESQNNDVGDNAVDASAAFNPKSDENEQTASADSDTVAASDSEEGSTTTNAGSLLSQFFNTPPVGYLIQGGLFMWPILLMGIIGAGVIIERYRSLNMLSGDSKQLRTDVQLLLETNQVRKAFELCNEQHGPVPAILATGLRKYLVLQTLDYEPAKIEEQVVKSMDDYSVHIVAALERHLPILATISSAAPMLGFLGTVQGMIVAFDDIVAKMGETNIVEAAAVGIKVSLMTTCFGLIVGIPAFVAFNYFTGLINRFVLDVEESATEMIEAVTLQTAISTADLKPEGEANQ